LDPLPPGREERRQLVRSRDYRAVRPGFKRSSWQPAPRAGWRWSGVGGERKKRRRARPQTHCQLVSARFLLRQFIEQRLGVLKVGGVEALGEPAVDVGEHCVRFVAAAVLFEQPREAYRRA
jgi:hypothetical protein